MADTEPKKEPYTVRWGILATGMIASAFVKDILQPTSLRNATDISHSIVAVASSRSSEIANDFISKHNLPPTTKPHANYQSLVEDPNVDIIYVATPHSHHYQNVMLCLTNSKHVLCEKAFTVNAAQLKKLIEVAKKKQLFLMEAVWTRYFPAAVEIRERINRWDIGEVKRVSADLSVGNGEDIGRRWDNENRMVSMKLAGGALLDLGIYSLTWLFQVLYHITPPESRHPPKVSSIVTPYEATGADETTTILLSFPSPSGPNHGIATTSLTLSTDPDEAGSAGPAVRIQGTKGEITLPNPIYRPQQYNLILHPAKDELNESKGEHSDSKEHTESRENSESQESSESKETTRPGEPSPNTKPNIKTIIHKTPGEAKGWCYEADEAARCLRDGKLESSGMPLEESVVIMEVMDEVRRQGGIEYPEELESLVWPLEF